MAVFRYSLRTKDGKITRGTLEVESREKALEYLRGQGGLILSLEETRSKKKIKIGKVKTDELVVFSRQLTTLIESSIPVVGSLEILVQQVENPYFKRVIGEIAQDLKEGSSLALSLGKHPKVFPQIYVSMVEAAEASGNLPQILDRVSVYLEKMSALRKKVIASMVYPTIVLIMTVVMTSFLLLKIIPVFDELYRSLGATLPLPTLILINFSKFFRQNIFYIAVGVAVGVFLLKKYISTPKGRKRYHRFILKLPIFGELFRKLSIAKFARTFATLVRSGVAIMNSLEIVGKTSGNTIIEEAMEDAKKMIQEGVPLSHPLEKYSIFPPMVVKMIAVGEKTGKLEHMLSKVAQFYEEQTEAVISALTSTLEPVLIVILGVIVGTVVIALFLPIFNISRVLLGHR